MDTEKIDIKKIKTLLDSMQIDGKSILAPENNQLLDGTRIRTVKWGNFLIDVDNAIKANSHVQDPIKREENISRAIKRAMSECKVIPSEQKTYPTILDQIRIQLFDFEPDSIENTIKLAIKNSQPGIDTYQKKIHPFWQTLWLDIKNALVSRSKSDVDEDLEDNRDIRKSLGMQQSRQQSKPQSTTNPTTEPTEQRPSTLPTKVDSTTRPSKKSDTPPTKPTL